MSCFALYLGVLCWVWVFFPGFGMLWCLGCCFFGLVALRGLVTMILVCRVVDFIGFDLHFVLFALQVGWVVGCLSVGWNC